VSAEGAALAPPVAAEEVPSEPINSAISPTAATWPKVTDAHVLKSFAAPMPQLTQPLGLSAQQTGPSPSSPDLQFF
jgi:hypothetical protein